MKKEVIARIIGIILGIALVISVVGNIYLIKISSDTKGEVTTLSSQLVTADNQITDLQAQVDDLQGQLTESMEQIQSLESTVAENNTTITDLEEQLDAQRQTASSQNSSSASTSGSNNNSSNSNDPYVGMPGYEGPKEGMAYLPEVGGYVPRDNSPGGNKNPGLVIGGGLTNEEYEAAGGTYIW